METEVKSIDVLTNLTLRVEKMDSRISLLTEKLSNCNESHEKEIKQLEVDMKITKDELSNSKLDTLNILNDIKGIKGSVDDLSLTLKSFILDNKNKVSKWTAFFSYVLPSSIIVTLLTLLISGKIIFK